MNMKNAAKISCIFWWLDWGFDLGLVFWCLDGRLDNLLFLY